jgi:hypothetical protein
MQKNKKRWETIVRLSTAFELTAFLLSRDST